MCVYIKELITWWPAVWRKVWIVSATCGACDGKLLQDFIYIYMYIYPAEVRERKLTETVIQELWWDIVLQNTYVLWSPYFSKIIYTQYIFEKKKTLYLIKMITAFSFFKLSYPEGQLGWVLSLPPMQLQLPSLSLPLLYQSVSLSLRLSFPLSFPLTPLWLSELLLQQYPIITISPAELQPAIIMRHY